MKDFLSTVSMSEVFDDFKLGVMAINAKGRVVYYNKAAAEIDGLEPDFVLGKDMINAYGPEPLPSPMMTCLHTGKPILGFALSYTTVRGRHISIEQDSYPLKQGKTVIGAIAFIRQFSRLSVMPPPIVSSVDELKDAKSTITFANLVGSSPEFLGAIDVARKAALSPSPVLLYGKTGTGKELFARSIHHASKRKNQPFVGINCSAIPANLLESVLFGTVRGAFTDAQDREGLFIKAKGGTLFLDELDSMPINLQPKLLRALQENKIQRIGSNSEEKIDVKIISSIAAGPEKLISQGRLRADLYYRLGVVVIPIPPLSKRLDDLEALCNYFIIRHNSRLGKAVQEIDAEVLKIFRQYDWPGNVRELEHVIEGTMNLMYDEEKIEASMLPQFFYRSMGFYSGQQALVPNEKDLLQENTKPEVINHIKKDSLKEEVFKFKKAEPELIHQALSKTYGNITAAAQLLDISRQNLNYKMKKYNLKRSDFQQE